ncbi:hydrolase [Muriicola sp. Z0-33]|uniref:hydrolase n=1 Tax=Muriicola sp. Z0-33 TaxID=2816957 RepID=UPI0022380179|nr:hydrolase [Muriicola sp. Z0-33]MCW5516651.1 hydrolase [Muriicola sp. Z0-33]
MKSKIFLYLFIFASMIALYLFVSSNNKVNDLDKRMVNQKLQIEALRDSLLEKEMTVLDMQYFSLENNDDALAYYDHLNINDPSRYIADKLLETNETKGDNPLVPYAGMENDFKINKIKILNHKWIVADFSDGTFWGELILKYELKDDLGVDFTLLDHLLYTRSN